MNITNLLFLSFLSIIGVTYFFIGLIKRDYILLACGILLGIYAFFVKDIVWLSLLGLVFLLSPFALGRILSKTIGNSKKEEIMDPILLRRSIRKYTSQPVPAEIVEYMLEAAQSAPSAGNESPWHFVVVNSKSFLEKIADALPNGKMLKEAPLAIVVCSDQKLIKYPEYWIQDCSAATENILLAAKTKGLGSVWLGVHSRPEREEAVKKILWLPENISPFSVVALGYPGEDKPYQKRYNNERIHYNGW